MRPLPDRFALLAALLPLGLAPLASCSMDPDSPVHAAFEDLKQSVSNFAFEQKEELIQMLEAGVEAADQQIDALRAKIAIAAIENKPALDEALRVLEEKKQVLLDQLERLRGAGSDAWEGVVEGAENARSGLADALGAAEEFVRPEGDA